MAVIRPHARIVRIDLDDQVSIPTEHMRVAADRVGGIDQRTTVPVAGSFGQDELQSWGRQYLCLTRTHGGRSDKGLLTKL